MLQKALNGTDKTKVLKVNNDYRSKVYSKKYQIALGEETSHIV